MRTLPVDEAPPRLPSRVDEAGRGNGSCEIARGDDRAAALREVVGVLAEGRIHAQHVGQADIASGDVLDTAGPTAFLAEEHPRSS